LTRHLGKIDERLGQKSQASWAKLPGILAKIDDHLAGGVVIDPVAALSAITIAVSSTFMCRCGNGGLHLE
jgi:hypothetical protein